MNRKLTIVVRGDLTPSQQAVQAGHAVADFCIWEYGRFRWPNEEGPRWRNGTLIYLRVDTLAELEAAHSECPGAVAFREPDLNYEMTAFATLTRPSWFASLPLL